MRRPKKMPTFHLIGAIFAAPGQGGAKWGFVGFGAGFEPAIFSL
jgi:hypothetical protein